MNNIHIKCFYGLLRQDINKTLTKHKIKHFTDSKEKSVFKTFYDSLTVKTQVSLFGQMPTPLIPFYHQVWFRQQRSIFPS